MSKQEFIGKVKTLSQGQYSDLVIDRMWITYSALVKEADFAAVPAVAKPDSKADPERKDADETGDKEPEPPLRQPISLGGLVYSIYLNFPESRDKAVYDVLFRSLREHLL